MNERPYLSIGDVLTLLREEFPDITISKIRFLESRGLLVPERTPSGYRKFYDHDVDRLRWILRQQRENFLPLKVIKGRLEGQEPSSEPTPLFAMDEPESPAALEPAFSSSPANGVRGTLEEGSSAPSRSPQPALAGARQGAVASGRSMLAEPLRAPSHERDTGTGWEEDRPVPPQVIDRGPVSQVAPGPSAGASGAAPSPAGGDVSRPGPLGSGTPPDAPSGTSPRSSSSRPGLTKAAKETGEGEAPVSGRPAPRATGGSEEAAEGEAAAGTAPAGKREAPPISGASLTTAELSQASGLEIADLEELESFGLIESRMVAGVACFDEEALVIARLAAGFARYGVEARHLRMFKHTAERQAGMYSQIVMPLLRQRNPEARRRAQDDLTRLTELGASLQACFAKAVLRDLTGG